jgi:hypothetical protein
MLGFRFGLAGPCHSSVVPGPPACLRGGSRSDAVPIVAPSATPAQSAAEGGSLTQRNGCSRRRARTACGGKVPPFRVALWAPSPSGTTRPRCAHKVPPLGRSPPRGCPLGPDRPPVFAMPVFRHCWRPRQLPQHCRGLRAYGFVVPYTPGSTQPFNQGGWLLRRALQRYP